MRQWSIDAVDIRDFEDIDDGLLERTAAVDEFLDRESSLRIVVAPKGFGKTLLLKTKRQIMESHAECLPKKQMVDVPSGSVQLDSAKAKLLKDPYYWELLWCVGVATAILRQTLKATADAVDPDDLRSNELRDIWNQKSHLTPSEQVVRLVNRIEPKEFFQSLQRDYSEVLVPALRVLHASVAVFVDNIDECFSEHLSGSGTSRGQLAPEVWHSAQIGLLRAAYHFGRLNPKIKLYGTIRLEAAQHMTGEMVLQHMGITTELEYGRDELNEIFRRNARKETPGNCVDAKNPDPVRAFLGRKRLSHSYVHLESGKQASEEMLSYIYRHTFGRPRDLMVIGRGLSETTVSHRNAASIRRTVNSRAQTLATEYLDEVTPHIRFKLQPLIETLPSNVVTSEQAVELCGRFCGLECEGDCAECAAGAHPMCAMYSLGLLGVIEDDFPNRRKVQRFLKAGQSVPGSIRTLPKSDYYLVHPALEDHLRHGDPDYEARLYRFAIIGDGFTWFPPRA